MMTIKLEDGKTVINVPQSWSEIKLEDYEKWFNIEPQNRRDEVEMVARICNIESALLLEYPTQLFDTIADSLRFIFEPHSFEPSHQITIDEETFMIAFSDNLSLAEWIDIELVFEDSNAPKLSSILSILCRPTGEIYDNKKSESRLSLFASLTMDKALPLLAFFLQRNNELETISNLYSQIKEQAEEYLQHIQDFAESGDGTKSLPIWQRIKYYCLTKFLKNRLSKYLASSSTN